jgi:hypothetical protein
MAFQTESSGYDKTILSELQGAWILLREAVVENGGFSGADRVLFHIDEAKSWESVRKSEPNAAARTYYPKYLRPEWRTGGSPGAH